MTRHLTLLLCGFSMLAGCAKEPPPRSVNAFVDNPILLEAAMVRCKDRAKTRYDEECINARQAVSRIQVKEEAAARAALEARSESKRAALRRTQAAAAEARRRAAEAKRLREEAEYLAQFGVLPPSGQATTETPELGNLPTAVVPDAVTTVPTDDGYVEAPPAQAGDGVPTAPDPQTDPTDLESIRDELRRRNEEGGG
jgi:hypothetical protein